jgi:hypothetical protein
MKLVVRKSFLLDGRYSDAVEFIDQITDCGEAGYFFGRARNEIAPDEIKTAIRKQASRFHAAHQDVALHSIALMHWQESEARIIVVLRDLMGDIERFMGQSLYWWGAVYENGEERHGQAIVLGRDELGDLVEFKDRAMVRLADNAARAAYITSIAG